jgi:predicted MFS family arabinose efflux permease
MFNTVKVLRSLAPQLQALFLTTLLYRAGTMAFPFYAVYLGLTGAYSISLISVMVGLFGAGALAADLCISQILKKLSAFRTIVVSLVASAALLVTMPLVKDSGFLMVLTFLWGFAYEAFTPAAYTETARCSGSEERKLAFSCNRLAVNIGMAIGPLIGSFLFPVSPLSLFYLNALLNMLALVAYLFAIGKTKNVKVVVEKESENRNDSSEENKRYAFSRVITMLLSVMPVHIAYALPPTFIAAYIIKYTSLPTYYIGAIFFINALLVMLFEIPINFRMKNWSSFQSMCLGYLLAGVGFSLMYFTSPGPLILLATAVWSFAEMIIFPSITHYISEISTADNLNNNLGLYSAGVNAGVMVTPAIALYLSASELGISPWLIIGGVLIGLAFLLKISSNVKMLWYKEA